jgi:hypothetical protein
LLTKNSSLVFLSFFSEKRYLRSTHELKIKGIAIYNPKIEKENDPRASGKIIPDIAIKINRYKMIV